MPIIFLIIFGFLLLPFASAQEPYTLEKIIVAPRDNSFSTPSLKNNYSTEIVNHEDIALSATNSVVDSLDHVSGIDLRYRSTFGIQGDLSLRGSTYEEVAILIDGVNVNDPQTGHHNLDIPLTAFDVEKIEIMKEGTSSLYGTGALAGSFNIIIKKVTKKVFNLETVFGQHTLFGQSASFSLPTEVISGRVSFDHKISSGGRPNTDFEYKTAALTLNKDWGDDSWDGLFGYQKKDFGADSFYSNLFPEEEEHTEAFFVKTGWGSHLNFGTLKNNLYLHKHRDKFILRRNNPTSVNYHTTYVYGLDSNIAFPLKYGDFNWGADCGRDEINSTNLGKHDRLHEAGFLGFTTELGNKFTADVRYRLDHYQRWPWQKSFNLGLGYDIIKEKLKLKGSLSRAFRIPSFTELYYSDAANKGNADLGVEKSDNFSLGLDFKQNKTELIVAGFLRRGHDLIDWTRSTTSDPWAATNLGRVDFKGVDFIFKLRTPLSYLEKIFFSYTYMEADKKAAGFLSKYALDILKHQFILDIRQSLIGLDLDWQLSYNERYYGETYFVGNLYVAKKFISKNFIFEPFLKIDNFSNTKYSELAGVIQPGRWVKAGLRLEW